MKNKIAFLFLMLGVGGVASCSSQSTGVGEQPSVAIVYGVVLNQAREPVPAAALTVDAFLESCAAADLFASGKAATDSTGYYRLVLGGPHLSQAETCIAVRVAPTNAYEAVTQSDAMVTFMHQADTPPIDSVRVDMVVTNH
jgi:hypothetical protein